MSFRALQARALKIRTTYSAVLSWGSWVALFAAIVVSAVQRRIFILKLHPPKEFVWSDMAGYVDRAMRLADPNVRLTRFDSFYPPGTHVLLAPLFALTRDRASGLAANQWLWWAFAVGAMVTTALLALKLFRHPLPAAVAVWALYADTVFMAYTGFFTSENPFSFLMTASLWLGLVARGMNPFRPWRRAGVYAICGLIAGIATTVRPQFGLAAALIGVPLLRRSRPFVHLREAAALAVFFLAPYLSAVALNSHAAGMRMGLSGNAGFNFYQGHCDVVHVSTHDRDGHLTFAAPVRIQRMVLEGRDPDRKTTIEGHLAWDNEFFFDQGFRCIRADGFRHLKRIGTNVADLFATTDAWPPNMGKLAKTSRLANRIVCWTLVGLLPLAAWIARRRRVERWLLLQWALVLPVGFLFYGDPRYRVPYDIFAALMLGGLVGHVTRLRHDGASGLGA